MTTATRLPANAKPSTVQATQEYHKEISGQELLNELLQGRSVNYVPMAEKQEVTLTVALVKAHLCVPTRTGKLPGDSDCIKYIMMCRQRGLNPWVGDCYLLGYDTQDGPKFSLITAIQALFKRAELARTSEGDPAFDGIESGVVVQDADAVIERAGDLVYDQEKLIGAWAKAWRKDRRVPFYQRLKLITYQKNTAIWKQDAAGMCSKCASAAALREAFPSDVGGLYLSSEIEAFAQAAGPAKPANTAGAVDLDTLTKQKPAGPAEPHPHQDEQPLAEDQPAAEEGFEQPPQDVGEPDPDSDPTPQISAEQEVANWRADIEAATTNGRLDQIAESAGKDIASQTVRSAVMTIIGLRRGALKKAKPKAGNGAAEALPGMQ